VGKPQKPSSAESALATASSETKATTGGLPPQPGRDRFVYVALLVVLGGLLYLATRL
jgi:hypothetical protein